MRARGRDERGAFRVGLATVVVLVGVAASIPFLKMWQASIHRADEGLKVVGQAQDVQAQVLLQNAIRGAEVYFAENGSFMGYGPEVARQFEPSIPYDTSPVAAPGRVSIRAVGETSLVMVTKSSGGGALCAAASSDVLSYGKVDASTPAACTGGWE